MGRLFPSSQLQRFEIQQECHLIEMRSLEAMSEIKNLGRFGKGVDKESSDPSLF